MRAQVFSLCDDDGAKSQAGGVVAGQDRGGAA